MKKAIIVEYCIRTRVIIEENDDVDQEFELAAKAAREKILADAADYIIGDNIVEIDDDQEMPYDPQGFDKE